MKSSLRFFALAALCSLLAATVRTQKPEHTSDDQKWFPYFDFDLTAFQKAPRAYGPYTRWWLPGNDLNSDELKREIRMFADNGFAGVEVQPLTQGLNPKAPKDQHDRIYSWDTPSFYQHLAAIMDQAVASGVTVDMNGGSGWPLGGSFFDPKESMMTLAVSDTLLKAEQTFTGPLPTPDNHAKKPSGALAMMSSKNFVDDKWAVLQSVIAAKVQKTVDGQTVLDPATMIDLTNQAANGALKWQAPEAGDWQLVASWTVPSGEKPSLIASSGVNYVIDHLDPNVVRKTYDYLLGSRTGLQKYYGKPLRAIFNDSYEFHTNRITSPDFADVFKKLNGYDIKPLLSSVFQQGYNHPAYLAAMYPGAKPPFVFHESEQWRIMYDYDVAVNSVFKNNFIKTSDNWLNERGMLHRTQAYGFPIDLIGSAGSADIPEAEQLFAEGSEGYLKLVTSGAHLYNRPVIAQESFVSILRAEMTTPQKIRLWADKSFACGINQLIYHGTPYKYDDGTFGKEGWNTWSSPHLPFVNFSTGMNETDPFWKDILAVNQYLARCQYALRAGKPKTSVLIYMPFIDFTEDQMAMNPKEILYRGYFKEVEPDIQGFGVFSAPDTPIHRWYQKLWPIVNELESKGISWEFVNDESLQKATYSNGKLNINGNQYYALILAHLPFITLPSAAHLQQLSKGGLPLVAVGELPVRQPSFKDFAANDTKTARLLSEAFIQPSAKKIADAEELLTELPAGARGEVGYSGTFGFARQITREMKDGSQIKFIWNMTDEWQEIMLQADRKFKANFWLNAEDGSVRTQAGSKLSYRIPPYGSVLLYSAVGIIKAPLLSQSKAFIAPSESQVVATLSSWDLKTGHVELKGTNLFDWKTNEALKFSSEEATYTTTLNLPRIGGKYVLDLGKVYYVGLLTVNGKSAGKRLFSPYQWDISQLLKPGKNVIQVVVTTSRRNGFIGEARTNPAYLQLKGKENTLVSSGLIGPVVLRKQ